MKQRIKKLLPNFLIAFYRKFYLKYTFYKFKGLSTEQVMSKIYEGNWWGGSRTKSKYFSGRGSHDEAIILPYIKAVSSFLGTNKYVVVDIGCGDFNVGSQLYTYASKYIACDIVPELIEHNEKTFISNNLNFKTLNLVEDSLPTGDVLIIRQVLQHLSNDNILKIVKKLYNYEFLILTEPIPRKPFINNKNNPDGPDIRLSVNSGIVLHEDPFNLQYQLIEELVKIEDVVDDAYIITTLYKLK